MNIINSTCHLCHGLEMSGTSTLTSVCWVQPKQSKFQDNTSLVVEGAENQLKSSSQTYKATDPEQINTGKSN